MNGKGRHFLFYCIRMDVFYDWKFNGRQKVIQCNIWRLTFEEEVGSNREEFLFNSNSSPSANYLFNSEYNEVFVFGRRCAKEKYIPSLSHPV